MEHHQHFLSHLYLTVIRIVRSIRFQCSINAALGILIQHITHCQQDEKIEEARPGLYIYNDEYKRSLTK